MRSRRAVFAFSRSAAHRNLRLLCEQAAEFHPKYVVASDGRKASRSIGRPCPQGSSGYKAPGDGTGRATARCGGGDRRRDCRRRRPRGGLGGPGMRQTVALANKETLVTAGPLVMQAREKNASGHSSGR